MSLFRPEVLEARAKKAEGLGSPRLTMPRGWWITSWLVLFFFIFSAIFFSTISVPRKETARGNLRFSSAESKVISNQPGVISACLVQEGNTVTFGQELAIISTEHFLENGPSLSDAEVTAITEKVTSLKERFSATSDRSQIEIQLLDIKASDLNEQATSQELKLGRINQRVIIAQDRDVRAEEDLVEGLISEPARHQRRESLALLEQELAEAESHRASLRVGIQSLPTLRKQITANFEAESAQIQEQIADANQSLSQVNAEKGFVLRAAMDGIIANSICRIGEAHVGNNPLMLILSDNSKLVGELFIPSRSIAFIEEGQEVHIRYDAFPYQQYGFFRGKVDEVSLAAFSRNKDSAGILSQGPAYRVFVSVDAQTVNLGHANIPLQSGMEFTAEIVLDEQPGFNWLLKSLSK